MIKSYKKVNVLIKIWNKDTIYTDHEREVLFNNDEIPIKFKKILPLQLVNELQTLKDLSVSNLKSKSYETNYGIIVPDSIFNIWNYENNVIQEKFMEAIRQIFIKYDDIKYVISETYKELAIKMWKDLYMCNSDNVPIYFITDFTEKILSQLPKPEFLVSKFNYQTNIEIINADLDNENISKMYKNILYKHLFKKKKNITKSIKSLNSVKRKINYFRQMKIIDNQEIDSYFLKIESEIYKNKKDIDINNLSTIINEFSNKIKNI